jgi:septum formation inhibitor-activating ATPase MinD
LEICVRGGFLNYEFLAQHDPFVVPLRDSDRFIGLLDRAAREREVFEAQLDRDRFIV